MTSTLFPLTTIADPTVPGQYLKVNSDGSINVTGGSVTYVDASGTVSTSSTLALAANTAKRLIWLQNTSANNLGYTLTGATAVIGGTATFTLAAGLGVKIEPVPTAAINVIGSASSTTYTLQYA